MELTELERAKIIINTLKNRIFQLEQQIINEQCALALREAEDSSNAKLFEEKNK